MNTKIRYTNILIASFSLRDEKKRTAINGMIEPLLDFFLPRAKTLDLIDGAHPGSTTTDSFWEHYENEAKSSDRALTISKLLYPFLQSQNTNATQFWFKLRDYMSVIEIILRRKIRYDLIIGLESVYTSAAILLKSLGLVKTVVYYVSDFSPKRYTNPLMNRIYLSLDRFCCYHADYIWDVSPAIHPARILAGLDPKKSAPVIPVPNALEKTQITPIPEHKTLSHSLVFAGTLGRENGPDIAVLAMPDILKKFPDATLHIFGGPEKETEKLKKLSSRTLKDKKDAVIFHGFISNATLLSEAIHLFRIGLAPYRAIPGSERYYGDATKLRLYMAAGLPVITTTVPPLGKEVNKRGAGLIVQDTPEDISEAVIILFTHLTKWKTLRKNAIRFAEKNTWDESYRQALIRMKERQ